MLSKFPTVAACDIVGLDRQRLNEDMAAGIYRCAPDAHSTTGRFFDEADLCALYVYAFFLRVYANQSERGARGQHKPALSKRVAAMYAAGIVEAMRSDLDGASRIDFPLNGFNDNWEARKEDQPPAFFAGLGYSNVQALGSNVATICFTLDGIRQEVRARVAHWSGEA